VLKLTDLSETEQLAALPDGQRAARVKRMTPAQCRAYDTEWDKLARAGQKPPAGDWRLWLIMAGRGFGKTRAGAEWVRALAEADGSLRIALVAASLGEARDVMVEGESGLLTIPTDDAKRPRFEPSLRRLTWPSGAIATLYSASEPENLRGPEHHIAWCDEIAKWDRGERAWDNLLLTLRLDEHPRIVATTTPRPTRFVDRLLKEAGVAVTRGPSLANAAHMPEQWLAGMRELYGGTRLGRQELEGELIADLEGALWSRELIERCRGAAPVEFVRVVIGVDPAASSGGDACGIVAVGKDAGGTAWVLGDHSISGRSPQGWARAVASAADRWGADRVIAEKNNGGDMVESTLRAADVAMPVRLVSASRGKVARAEPVVALYEQGKARHAGAFPALEDEMCGMCADGSYAGPGRSPDRADAMVWAMSELMLGKGRAVEPRVRVL
jgi:phage terminase large subunit-like protein